MPVDTPITLAPSALSFDAYVLTAVVLSLNLILLWVASGATRAKSGVAINPEDGVRFKAPVAEIDPPAVARILRAHRNAEAVIYPFLIVGLAYVLAGGSALIAASIFGTFTLARIAHSIVYVRALQPARTLTFAASLLILLGLMAATGVQIGVRFIA